MNRHNEKESATFKFYMCFSISEGSVLPDNSEVAVAVVVLHGVG